MCTLMHSYIASDPYCLLYYGPLFFLLGMSVVGPLEIKLKERSRAYRPCLTAWLYALETVKSI